MSDLLGDHHAQETAAGPAMGLGALQQIAPPPAGVRKVEPAQQGVKLNGAASSGKEVVVVWVLIVTSLLAPRRCDERRLRSSSGIESGRAGHQPRS